METSLFVSALVLAARAHVVGAIGDADSFYDDGHRELTQAFAERATVELADGQDRDLASGPADRDPPPERFGPALTALAGAALAHVGRAELAPRVIGMLDSLAAAFQIRDDLTSMHRDLLHGRSTYPIQAVAQAAGIGLDPWPDPNVVLGAMVATGSLRSVVVVALQHVRGARQAADELELPTFAAYLSDVEAGFQERLQGASGGVLRSGASPLVFLVEATLPKALAMAEAALLSDTTFRESWELHREGMFGAPEVASRFPAGLILEILCARGHVLASEVDAFLSFTDANHFRYYDHPWSDVDTDSIGVYLRLLRYADPAWRRTDALGAVLACLEREVRAGGEVPVWLRGCAPSDDQRPPVLALGEGCGAVAAHLLLGLIAADRLDDVAEIGVAQLMGRIGEVGLAASVNYPPLYALAIFLRLVARLPGGERTAEVRAILMGELEKARLGRVADAQDAAFLAIACFEAGSPDLVDPAWITAILKRQRFDGSWLGEPFAAAPNRGRYVTWYTSSTLTTALCYDALMWYAGAGDGIRVVGP